MNTVARASILAAVVVVCTAGILGAVLYRSPYMTGQDIVRDQPVPFSHEHHAGGLGIDCRYCHFSVEESSFAGIPATKVCMNCHTQIWQDSPMLEHVRASFRNDVSLEWTRVHKLPDYAYFNHSIHVNKGMGCAGCHGRVDKMPLMWQSSTMLMQWCIDCHRHPERQVVPRDEVFNMSYTMSSDKRERLGKALVTEYNIQSKTSCSTCHR